MELRVGSVNSSWCSYSCRCCSLDNCRCSSNGVCGGQVVAIVGGVRQIGVADLRCHNRGSSSSVGRWHNWQWCSSRSSNRSSSMSIDNVDWKVCGTDTETKGVGDV